MFISSYMEHLLCRVFCNIRDYLGHVHSYSQRFFEVNHFFYIKRSLLLTLIVHVVKETHLFSCLNARTHYFTSFFDICDNDFSCTGDRFNHNVQVTLMDMMV